MYRVTTFAAAALLALGLAACSESTTSPETEDLVNVDLVAVDDYGFTLGSGPGPGCTTGPAACFAGNASAGANRSYLGTLVQEAYQQLVAEQGQDAADAAFATLWQLHQDAFALRRTDHDAFVTAMQAAHSESATLVIRVLGNEVAAAVIELAGAQLDALEDAIAASSNPARLEYVAERAAAYLAAAQAKLDAEDYQAALDLASRALQAATVGGGQAARGAGQGAGTGVGEGAGQQYRGGQ